MRHMSNPNTTSRTPDTNTTDKQHQINPPFHQKTCYTPAIKSKEATPKHKKHSAPQRRIQKPQVTTPETAPPQQRKAGQTQPDSLSSCHKGTLNKDNPSTAQPSRRNISQTPTFHMEQITAIITTHTTPSPQAPQRYAPPRGGAPTENLHLSSRTQA